MQGQGFGKPFLLLFCSGATLLYGAGCQQADDRDAPPASMSQDAGVQDVARDDTDAQGQGVVAEAATGRPAPLSIDAASTAAVADAAPTNGQVAPASHEGADSETSSSDHGGAYRHGKSANNDDKPKLDEQLAAWKEPQLILLLSGGQHGYLEPCGCAGLDNMKGGLARRHTLVRRLERLGAPVIGLDAGDLVRRSGPQAIIKYQRSIDSLLTMRYQAIGFGFPDLRLPAMDLVAAVPADGRPTPFVSANVGLIELGDETISARYRVFEAGGVKLGVTSVLVGDELEDVANPDLVIVDAEEALAEVVPALEAAGCDRLILLVSGDLEAAAALAAGATQFDFVVTPGESDPPPPAPSPIEGSQTQRIELSHKGMYVGVLGFFDDATTPFRYQRLSIDSRFEDSAEMKAMLASYQEQLKSEGFERLGIYSQPAPHDDKFVGSKACQACHEEEFDIWKESGHSHGTDTLVHLKPPRQFDAECLSCHVTGWQPQDYVPFDTGYVDLEKTPHLVGVGCENCHGPGGAHVALETAAENGDEVDEDRQDTLYLQMRNTIADARKNTCTRCHDLDNSPDFDFDTYWPKIEH